MRIVILLISFFISVASTYSQYTFNGTLQNQAGEKLFFATVFFENTSFATSTDEKGRFELNDIPKGNYQLKITFIGYQGVRKNIEINSDLSLDIVLSGEIFQLDAIEIQANRVGSNSPFTATNMDKSQLQKENLGTDVPYILQWTPSMVVTSDAGTGIGYTGLRLRGSDQSRINVTINGVPLNDGESQNVFWVDLPDLMASVKNIQIQRGVGTSTNGAGAFGGTVSINTNETRINPYIDIASTIGSFNTRKLNINLGTGLVNNKYQVSGRYSSIKSDGFVDRASADLTSLAFSAARLSDKSSLRLNIMSGHEVTYQAWNGVPEAKLTDDKEKQNAHFQNNIGSIYKSQFDSINYYNSGRSYNYYGYENQVDDYRQTHVQLIHALAVNPKLKMKSTLYYTKGNGFFEEFKYNDKLSKYSIPNFLDSIGNEVSKSNITRKRWLNNDLLGFLYDVDYQINKQFDLQAGLSLNKYVGDHFGQVINSNIPLPNFNLENRYYDNTGNKSDASMYLRAIYQKGEKLSIHGDLQFRKVDYKVGGIDNDLRLVNVEDDFLFFNPKLGINYQFQTNQNFYISFAMANKEPSRGDYVDQSFSANPQPENLQNLEAGYVLNTNNTKFETNLYFMNYNDQLVLTGDLNDVGSPIRVNVPKSYRLGWETSVTHSLNKYLAFNVNSTLSRNKINAFDEVLFDYTIDYERKEIRHENTDISFSPSFISAFQVLVKPIERLEIEFSTKYVSKQFLDNTSNNIRSLPAYHYENLRFGYNVSSKYWKSLDLTLMINNILNTKYSSNGYTYSYIYGDLVTENFYYPQAGTHVMFGIKLGL